MFFRAADTNRLPARVRHIPFAASGRIQLVGREEAREVARDALAELRDWSYERLVGELLGTARHETRVARSGHEYPVEIQGFWDTPRRPGLLRVVVCADPGGRRWIPRSLECDDFIIRPDGTFVGE